MRLGLLAVSSGEFATLEMTAAGGETLRTRRSVILTQAMEKPAASAKRTSRKSGEIECDEILFGHLRKLRKRLADERGVPAYIVCGDVTLRELARYYPTTVEDLAGITGFGTKKLADYGELFSQAVNEYLANNSRVAFRD